MSRIRSLTVMRAVAAVVAVTVSPLTSSSLAGQSQAVAGEGTPVHGIVRDAGSGIPISGVHIEATVAHRHTETHDDGTFTLPVAPRDTLVVRAIGYRGVGRPVTGADSVFEFRLEGAPAIMPGLVATASRRPQQAGESPLAVTTLDHGDLRAVAAPSVDRAITQVPGLQILPTAPTGADLSIRGMDGARVLVLVDGEPIAGDLLENRDLSRTSTLAVDRIEVVKGPLSALYGSDALGGVVNVLTQDPTGPFTLHASGRAGDGGRRELELGASAGGTLSYRLSGGLREQRAVASTTRPDAALDRVWDVRSTVRWAASPTFRVRTDLSLLRERQRWQLSADGFNGFNDNRGFSGWVEAVWAQTHGAARARLYAEDYTHRFRQAKAAAPLASDTAPEQQERMAKASLGYTRRWAAHTLDAGVDLTHRSIDSPGKVDGIVADDMAETYLQDGWALGRFLVTPAARFSWNSRWGTAVTPSVAAAWDVGPALRLRAGLARGFRGPSFKELAWDFPNAFAGYAIRGNPSLAPERSWQASAGISWAFAAHVVAEAELYRNEVRDLIELVTAGTDTATDLVIYSPSNLARARTQGVDLGLHWTGGRWLAALGYSYLAAKDLDTGLPLDRRAAHSGRLRLGRELARLGGDITLVYTGSAPAQQADGMDGRQAAYLSTTVQSRLALMPALELSLGVDNLFDVQPAGWVGVFGRRVYAGVHTSWNP